MMFEEDEASESFMSGPHIETLIEPVLEDEEQYYQRAQRKSTFIQKYLYSGRPSYE